MPVPGPQAERNPVWDVAPGPAIRASGPWPPRSRPAPPRLPPSRSEPPRPRAPAPCPPRHHAVWGPMALPLVRPGPGARAPCTHVYIDIRPYRRHIGVRRGWCMHMPGIARDRPHNGRFWAVRSTASAVQGQRPLASRSKLNILFDHALGLFKILDHTEPNSHALPPHHCTAPARTPPCTTLALHHLDSFCTTLALHHTTPHSPAPHSPCTTRTTLACTTFALHHTLDLVLHHAIHHSRPAPHCTLACSTSALHHICLAPRVMSVYHTAHIYTLHS